MTHFTFGKTTEPAHFFKISVAEMCELHIIQVKGQKERRCGTVFRRAILFVAKNHTCIQYTSFITKERPMNDKSTKSVSRNVSLTIAGEWETPVKERRDRA